MLDKKIMIILLAVVLLPFIATSYSSYLPPLQQINNGVEPDNIQCNTEFVHALRTNGDHVCVKETTAKKLNWEIVLAFDITSSDKMTSDDSVFLQSNNDKFVELNVLSSEDFILDEREIKRVLQRAPAPWLWYEIIMDSEINPNDIGPDNLVRLPATVHEKYSVKPNVGFYIEDWMPTHILDGQKLLYADTDCYASGDCFLKMQFVPKTFVLNKNVTDFDLDISKGFVFGVNYSITPLDEIEDVIEEFRDSRESQSGTYGGHVDMTRDGKTVSAYQGGNDLNHYAAGYGLYVNDHTAFYVNSNYHTLDELLPVFNSIGK